MAGTIENIFEEVIRLNEKLDALPGLIEIASHQLQIVSIDELSENLGLIKAGEFRSGNLRSPGDSFSGMRIGYPAFQYPATSTSASDAYHLVGVDADTLMIGISATDGRLYFGGGAGWLDNVGITLSVAGNSDAVPMLRWFEGAGDTVRGEITVFEILGDSDNMSFEILAGGEPGFADSAAPQYQQIVLSAVAHEDSGTSSGEYTFLHEFLLQAGDTLDDGLVRILDWNYLFIPHDTATEGDLVRWDILDVFVPEASTGLGEINWNPGNQALNFVINGDSDLLYDFSRLVTVGSTGYLALGGLDTTNFDLGWLGEKALTFNSTATAGIEDPDNEMGKLWLDTDFEMRLTDTAGEDWYIGRSTSTSGPSDWSTFAPTITAGAGTLTTASATGRYTRMGQTVLVSITGTITTNGTGASWINLGLPIDANTVNVFTGVGRENAVTGYILQGIVASTEINCLTYDNLYPGGDGRVIRMNAMYQAL